MQVSQGDGVVIEYCDFTNSGGRECLQHRAAKPSCTDDQYVRGVEAFLFGQPKPGQVELSGGAFELFVG